MAKGKTRKTGRPSKLDTLDLDQVAKLYKKGWTDAEVADFYSVTRQTLDNWKQASPDFFASLRSAKQEADEKVEKSLYQRATGYVTKKTEVAKFQGKIGEVIEVDEYIQPDVTACIFWLKNRKPAEWRDKQELEHSGGPLQAVLEVVRKTKE